jgi:mRNA interferase RelE/StbE
MDCYKIIWKSSAEKELRKLPRDVIARLLEIIENLAINPYPSGIKKLIAIENTYRIRYGDYRVIYELSNDKLIVHIIRVGHRREVYR